MGNTRSRNRSSRLIVGLALASSLFAVPAAAKKMRPVYPIEEIQPVASGTRIVVLPPLIRFETLPGADKPADDSADDVAVWLQRLALEALTARGFDTVSSAEDDAAARQLQTVADHYVRTRRGPEATVELINLAAQEGDRTAVLLQYLEIQLASRGYWNSGTGALGVGMSNSDLHGVLLDANSGEVLWRGELYYRAVPEIDSRKWNTAVIDMYTTLVQGGEER